MQITVSSMGVLPVLMLAASCSFASASHPNNPAKSTKIIYGVANAQYVDMASKKQFYVQAGAFKHVKNANTLQERLTKKYHQPVTVKPVDNYYVVRIGPMNASAVRVLNSSTPTSEATSRSNPVDGIESTTANHFNMIGAIGVASLNAGDGSLGVTSSETDKLVQTNKNQWDTVAAQIGFGYVYYFHKYQPLSDQTQWFTAIEPQINGYYLGQTNINGDVWRFEDPRFNDMTYQMPIESYRLMLDGALTVVARKQYSLYVKGGIGNAWNRVGYSDADRDSLPCAEQFLNLNSTTQSNFAWEAGAGLVYKMNNRASFSLEYLYTDLGNVKTPDTGLTGSITTPVLVPASFRLTSQAALLGLHVTI